MVKACYNLLFVTLLFSSKVSAQEAIVHTLKSEMNRTIVKEIDSIQWNWKKGGMFTLNLSQGTLSNWAAGGENFSLTISTYFNYYYYYNKGRYSWDNNANINLGFIQTTSKGGRKNDDRVDLLSKYGYEIDSAGRWYLSGLFNFRTQMFDGYTYSGNTIEYSSSLLSPAYVVLSAGYDYKYNDKLSIFLSPITNRLVIVLDDSLSKQGKYGVEIGKHTKVQLGAFITINYNNNIAKNLTYKSRLDLFSNYLSHPENINIFLTNQLSCKISKYFSVSYSFDLIYDDNIRLFGPSENAPGVQFKSILGVGFMAPLRVKRKLS